LLFPNDITYTIGKSDWHKDWFFEETPHATNLGFVNPAAKDPANQPFGWVNNPTGNQDMWRQWGRGRATTWTVKFNMDKPGQGQAVLRVALAGSDSTAGLNNPGSQGAFSVGVNGKAAGAIRIISTNALRYNTDRGVWRQYAQTFDASLLKPGENSLTLTVPAGDCTSGVVYDYLRLELNDDKITFDVSFNGTTIHHEGTVNGDEIKLTTKSDDGNFPGGEMTLKRSKPAQP
jgi:rhamnogalacturonan endolyase